MSRKTFNPNSITKILPVAILIGAILLGVGSAPSPADDKTAGNALPVKYLRIIQSDSVVIIDWKAHDQRLSLSGVSPEYRIFFGNNPEALELIATTKATNYAHHKPPNSTTGFYQVLTIRNPIDAQELRPPHRDDVILFDFDEGEFELESYSEEEDIDAEDWELDSTESYADSERSLKLFGNTWKKLSVDSIEISDSTVWSIAVLSIDGDSLADLQAIGISDGENELYYAFHGERLIWEQPWIVSSQDYHERGEWQVYRWAVGYDWTIRYEYAPFIEEIYFINDNDENDPPSEVYFDELTDITESIALQPQVQIVWSYLNTGNQPQTVDFGAAVEFHAEVENYEPEQLTYLWELGDGTQSALPALTHYYPTLRNYTVSLTVESEDGPFGHAMTNVSFDELPTHRSITACFTGDVMLARRYDPFIELFGPEWVFERIRPYTFNTDLSVINLESVLTDEGSRHPTKSYIFRGSPENVAGLTSAGFDMANLANNHVHDYGRRGLEETIETLDTEGIAHSGGGMNEYLALQPAFRTVKGLRVGLLGYCNRTGRDSNRRPVGDAGYDKFGFAYFSADNLMRSIPEAADLCDMLVIYVHGGSEYATAPTRDEANEQYPPDSEERIRYIARRDSATIELMHFAIDLGADLVIGNHPHVLQGFEIYEGVVIAHSLGNFAFDQNFFETWPSALVYTDITGEGVVKAWIMPVFVDNYRPTPATGALGSKILDRLAGYSTDLGTMVIPDYESMTASIVLNPDEVELGEREFTVSGRLRYFEDDSVYISEPLRLNQGGFPAAIMSIEAEVEDPQWEISLGREILLVGNMESEGAEIWNYNSNWEGFDEDVVHNGDRSSYLIRQQGWQDGITDIKQRIPARSGEIRLALCGWLRTENALDAGIVARYYRYRYNNQDRNILGDQAAERRLNGDNDWTYLWDELALPEGTAYMNVRWQLFGADEGANQLWADDIELIRWDEPVQFEEALEIPTPNELYYLQVRTTAEVDEIEVTYRSVVLHH